MVGFGGSRFRCGTVFVASLGLFASSVLVGGLPAVAAPVSDGLLASYDFNETSGTVLSDKSGNGLDGTVVGEPVWTGTEMEFSGQNYVKLPDDFLKGRSEATIVVEALPDEAALSTSDMLWSFGGTGDARTGQFFMAPMGPRAAISRTNWQNGAEQVALSPSKLVAGQWQSIAVSIGTNADGNTATLRFYVNGELVAERANSNTRLSDLQVHTNNLIGGSAYSGDAKFTGAISDTQIYNRALTAQEIFEISEEAALEHVDSFEDSVQAVLDMIPDPLVMSDQRMVLPAFKELVTWDTVSDEITIDADGVTARATQPAIGRPPAVGTLLATAKYRGLEASREIAVEIEPTVSDEDEYGYLMVHHVEAPREYKEKIYLSISRGDDPEQWERLNGGEPILTSHLGTTGVRDPYLTYSPETQTYYIIATDLRAYAGVPGSWPVWNTHGSTKLHVWESKDLVTWSNLHQLDVAADRNGDTIKQIGMAWAPEATWVPDYYGEGDGAFVLYWSSNLFPDDDVNHSTSTYHRVLIGATKDFNQNTYDFLSPFVDIGSYTIDTNILQANGKTYRTTKDNTTSLFMEVTESSTWWLPSTKWDLVQRRICITEPANIGPCEAPLTFKSHKDDLWYLYGDLANGYKPMYSRDLDNGWRALTSPLFDLPDATKHGGVISLTKKQYDTIRGADAGSVISEDLGVTIISEGADEESVLSALPNAKVNLAFGLGESELPVTWDVDAVDFSAPGTYEVEGTVQSIGANENQWVGAGGSTAYDAPDRQLYSSTALNVKAAVVVEAVEEGAVSAVATTRCVAGKVVVASTVTNSGREAVTVDVESLYGSKSGISVPPGKSVSQAFSTRLAEIPAGSVRVNGQDVEVGAEYSVSSCG